MSEEPNTGALVPDAQPARPAVNKWHVLANLGLTALAASGLVTGPHDAMKAGESTWPPIIAFGLLLLACLVSLADMVPRYRKGLPHSPLRAPLSWLGLFLALLAVWFHTATHGDLFGTPIKNPDGVHSVLTFFVVFFGLMLAYETITKGWKFVTAAKRGGRS